MTRLQQHLKQRNMSRSKTEPSLNIPLSWLLVTLVCIMCILSGVFGYVTHLTTENNELRKQEQMYIETVRECWAYLDFIMERIEPYERGKGLRIRSPEEGFRPAFPEDSGQ